MGEMMENGNKNERIKKLLRGLQPVMVMVLVQLTFAGVNVFYKIAANDGMNLRILIAYRFIFAAAFIVPLAYFVERKTRPKLTWTVLGQAFLCGLFGGSLIQNLYLVSLTLTSATFAAAMANLVPGVTFILAVSFGLEKLGIRSFSGKAKVAGTLLGIGGAMLLTFFKGVEIHLWSSNIHLLHGPHGQVAHGPHDHLWGVLTSIAAVFSYAGWLIVQTKMSQKYPAHYSSTALMSIMGSVQAFVYALCTVRDWEEWKLGWNIRLLTVAYTGIVASGVSLTLIAWCVRMKGPLFVSIFNPLMLIAVALAGNLMLDEKLYLGSVLGAAMIVLGLYAVLWGKDKEMKMMRNRLTPSASNRVVDDQQLEIITSPASNRKSDGRLSDGLQKESLYGSEEDGAPVDIWTTENVNNLSMRSDILVL